MKSTTRGKLPVIAWLMFMLVMPLAANAAMPEKIGYQGNLTNSLGTPVTGNVQIVFSIYTVDTGGTALWTETQTVSVSNGAYSVVLGSVTPFNENLKFDNQYYLGVKVGTDAEMTPRRALTSSGYSMRAKVADSLSTSILPPGMVVAFAGTTAPSGWLLCDGSEVSRTTYADLFAAIGTAHGAGDGTTTFNLPDYRGRSLRGVPPGTVSPYFANPAYTYNNGYATAYPTNTNPGLSSSTLLNVGSVQTYAVQQPYLGYVAGSYHFYESIVYWIIKY